MRIVFMGTPDFALPCLRSLIESKHEVCAVFSQPDKPVGRHGVITPPPVKQLAESNGIPVYQPSSMKDGTALGILKEYNPDLCVVVAFGRILPADILEFPKYGCINIHASLLPLLRGAAPVQWSVINGFRKTGVTAMQMDVGLDTGDILLTKETEIGENETSGELFDRISEIAAETLMDVLPLVEQGKLNPVKQNDSEFTYAPMLSKEMSAIDFSMAAAEVHNRIRGLNPWPGASTTISGKPVKLHKSVISLKSGSKPGEVICSDDSLSITCGDLKCIDILVIQAQGKKAMSVSDFLRGNRIESGIIAGEES